MAFKYVHPALSTRFSPFGNLPAWPSSFGAYLQRDPDINGACGLGHIMGSTMVWVRLLPKPQSSWHGLMSCFFAFDLGCLVGLEAYGLGPRSLALILLRSCLHVRDRGHRL